MRCIICEKLSWNLICNSCQEDFLQPSIFQRDLEGLPVLSFYQYEDIGDLILTKNSYLGFYVFQILAKNSFKKFSENFKYPQKLHSIGIDERTKNRGYSHTAILSKSLKSKLISPIYNTLHSRSDIRYLGQNLIFRKKNRRNFIFKQNRLKYKKVILVDDVITTGTTLREAKKTVSKKGFQPILAITLATTEK